MAQHFDFVDKFENEIKLESLQNKYNKLIFEEQRFNKKDEEYSKFMENKQAFNKKLQDIKLKVEYNKINIEALDISTITNYIKDISYQVKKMCMEISSNKLDNATIKKNNIIIQKMESLRNSLLFKESEIRRKQVDSLMKSSSNQRKSTDNQNIYQNAKIHAERIMLKMMELPNEEIAKLFNVRADCGPICPEKKSVFWFHETKTRQDNIVPIPPPYPRRFNKFTKKMEDYNFTVFGFFKTPEFIEKLNKYYNSIGLEISFQQDSKFKWKITLNVISIDETIKFPFNNPRFIDNIEFSKQF